MNNTAKTTGCILVSAVLGWLAGEVVSRTLLSTRVEHHDKRAAEAGSNDTVRPVNRENGSRSEWRELLAARNISSFSSGTETDETAIGVTVPDPASGRILIEGADNRLNLLRKLIHASPAEFPQMLNDIARIGDARVRRQVAEAFFAAWAQHDPRAAIEASNKIPGLSMAGLNGALKSWTEKDPRGLMAWLRSADMGGWARMQAQTNAFVFLTETDPLQAMQLAAESGRTDARRTVFINWYGRDPEAADAWIAAAPEADRKLLFDSWVGARSANDPAATWQLALDQAPDRKQLPKLLRTVFATWLDKDAPAARAALTKLPAEVWEPSFSSITGTMLGQNEAQGLGAMAAELPKSAQDSFWAGVASGAVESGKSIEFAAGAFSHLPDDSDDRIDLADRITKQWVKTNPRAASEWVRGLSHSLARDMAAAALAEGLILTDPDAAAQWAADIRNEKMRLGVQKRITK